MISIQFREKKGAGLGYNKCEPPFNHNYSSLPRVNTSYDELVSKSDLAHEFPNVPVQLTVDPIVPNVFDMSELNPNCERYVPTVSLEQVSANTLSGQGNFDVEPFDPIEFHQKVCCYACGKPCHIARHCLHRPTEFFYGKNQKVTPKEKPYSNPMRIDQSSRPLSHGLNHSHGPHEMSWAE
ncbi:hypothetical protein R6Q57_016525 [Mikania cordata]